MNTFSISFSDNDFQLIHVVNEREKLNLQNGNQFPYPHSSGIDQVFCEENIAFVSNKIAELRKEKNIELLSLAFSIPFNYAVVKKVAFPHDSNKEQKRNQIEWELSANLSEPVKSYKIMIINQDQTKSAYAEATVVAISKEIIQKLLRIAEHNNAEIDRVFLNCFALENFLTEDQRFKDDTNYYLLKNGDSFLEHHFFAGKQYLLSFVDPIKSNRSREEYTVERSNERFKQVGTLFSQINKNRCVLYAYGNGLESSTMDNLKSGLSIDAEFAELNNFPIEESFKYIEAWGAVL